MSKADLNSASVRNKKRVIGIVAITLLLVFTVLAILQFINYIAWILGDLVVAGIANLLLRRIGRRPI